MTEPLHVVEPDHPPRTARFGTFEADLHTGELRRDGRKVRIQDQPFRILALLLDRAGQIVPREELRERLWPAEFVDFDHSLNAAIRKLREALGDSAENPRFVETLARRGYRFIAPVSWDGETPKPAQSKSRIGFAAMFAVLIIAAIGWLILRKPPVAAANTIDAVAVLPFTNDDPQTQHVSDGLTEILIDRLSRLPDLRVMARETVFSYKGKDPHKAGQAMNVGGIVTGNMRRLGDRYQIHVELIDVKDGSQLWGHQFEATAATLTSVQGDVCAALTMQLRQGVSREQRQIVATRYTHDSNAYDSYLWGLYALNNRQQKGSLTNAITWFNQAIDRDPNFAAAYAGLANTYGVMVGYGLISVPEGTSRVLTLSRKAIELDPNNAEALIAIATTKYRNLWDFPGAETDYRRALAINPNYATGHQWFADYLRSMGRWADSRREIETAYKLDPLAPAINSMMCFNYYYERRFNEAIAFSQRAAEIDPRFASTACVGSSLMALGDIEGTMRVLRYDQPDSRALPKEPKKFYLNAAEWLQQTMKPGTARPVTIASMYAMAGRPDDAFAWLEKAYQSRVSQLTNVNIDPSFESLHNDPRYIDLLRRIGLPRVEPPRIN